MQVNPNFIDLCLVAACAGAWKYLGVAMLQAEAGWLPLVRVWESLIKRNRSAADELKCVDF